MPLMHTLEITRFQSISSFHPCTQGMFVSCKSAYYIRSTTEVIGTVAEAVQVGETCMPTKSIEPYDSQQPT